MGQPYLSLWGSAQPTTESASISPLSIGQAFKFDIDAWVYGVRYARSQHEISDGVIALGGLTTGAHVSAATFMPHGFTGAVGTPWWNTAYFHPRIAVAANANPLQLVIMWANVGAYWYTPAAIAAADYINGHVRVPQKGTIPAGHSSSTWTAGAAPLWPHVETVNGDLFAIDVLFLPR